MDLLYLWLNIGSISIPFLFSFHPKLQFYKRWRNLSIGIFFMMAFFISWDIIFTNNEIWGFNESYITGIHIFNLPLEEWLFFICIPYACIFTHYSLYHFFPNMAFGKKVSNVIYLTLVSALIITLWYHYDKWYTFINFSYALILLGLVYNYQRETFRRFLPTFLVILIPFFLVNGILTGSGIAEQVVWYDDSENVGVRLFTIPIEDTIYAFGMLLTVLTIMEAFEQLKPTPSTTDLS